VPTAIEVALGCLGVDPARLDDLGDITGVVVGEALAAVGD